MRPVPTLLAALVAAAVRSVSPTLVTLLLRERSPFQASGIRCFRAFLGCARPRTPL